MLTADDLAAMRETLDESMPDTCTLVLDTLTPDGAGGHTRAPVDGTTVACRIGPRQAATASGQIKDSEVEAVGRVLTQAPWLITLPFGTTFDERYRIRHQDGREFETVAILGPRTWGIDIRILCRLLNAGAG